MRTARIAAAITALTLATACAEAAPAEETPPSENPPAQALAPGRVGAPGSACPMPIELLLAEDWQAAAPDLANVAPEGKELLFKGGLTPLCELDAKPAGHLGFIRVYGGPGADPRTALTAFIGPDAKEPIFTDVQLPLAGLALEVVYTSESPLGDGPKPERAFALPAGDGMVAVALDSVDRDDHDAMLPAYEMAKTMLTIVGQ